VNDERDTKLQDEEIAVHTVSIFKIHFKV